MNGRKETLLLGVFALLCVGCSAPMGFVQTSEPTWATIELRETVTQEKAWPLVIDLLTKRFDIAYMSKESGYARTGWLYTWTGELRADYRVRATIKFPLQGKTIDVKSEAEYGRAFGWVRGTDTRLLQTLKSDIMGTLGRVTR